MVKKKKEIICVPDLFKILNSVRCGSLYNFGVFLIFHRVKSKMTLRSHYQKLSYKVKNIPNT